MKKFALLLSFAVVLLLTACVPDRQEEVLEIGPNMEGQDGTPVDFEILAIDTMDGIDDMEPYSFVVRSRIEGNNDDATVRVIVGTMDEVEQGDADAFAAVIMKSMGISAASELKEYNQPTKDSFGDFWDKYSISVEFYKDEDLEKEGAAPYYTFTYKAGEQNPLNPDVSLYQEDYYKRKEILERSL